MRLRSSQFVFLLLLVCSLQIRGDYAAQLIAGAVDGGAVDGGAVDGGSMATPFVHQAGSARAASSTRREPRRSRESADLDASARSAHQAVWTVRPPAFESAAVVSFTGFLRA